jgi:hypothetical protein
LHASLVGNELAELQSDPSVVGGLGNQSFDHVSMCFTLACNAALRFLASRLSRSNMESCKSGRAWG